jgi:hypothetical protein
MIKNMIKEKIYRMCNNILDLDAKDIERALQRKALESTVNFILNERRLLKAKVFKDKFELLKDAVKEIIIDGVIMEFGVYKGETINYIAALLPNKQIYGFDSFEGLPETWRFNFYKGKFSMDKIPEIKNNVTLIKGWFENTLPNFLKKIGDSPIGFMHIDCDLYSSTKTIFYYLKNNVVPGTVIVFDEFFNYPGWEDGEFKAFYEFVEECEVAFEWIGFVINHEQVGLKITRIKKG